MLSYTSLQTTFVLKNGVGENRNDDDNTTTTQSEIAFESKKYILVNRNGMK